MADPTIPEEVVERMAVARFINRFGAEIWQALSQDNKNEHFNDMRAALAAIGPEYAIEPGWQPIETYPNDGSAALVYRPLAPTKRMFGLDSCTPAAFGGQWAHSRRDEPPTLWKPAVAIAAMLTASRQEDSDNG